MVKDVHEYHDDEEEPVERGGLDHALYDFPDMEARPAESFSKTKNNKLVCLLILSSLGFMLILIGIVKGVQKSDSTETVKSTRDGEAIPLANGDLPNMCSVDTLADSNLKQGCIEECKAGVCCLVEDINDALGLVDGPQRDINMLTGGKTLTSCYDEYQSTCDTYEPCLNLLYTPQEASDFASYTDSLIPPPDENIEIICSQTDLNECTSLCQPAKCCRSSNPCTDVYPTECASYSACDILEEYEDREKHAVLVDELCTFDYVSTKEGRMQCQSACKDGLCCFDSDIPCPFDVQELCDDYKPCAILDIVNQAEYHHIIDDDKTKVNDHEVDAIKEACTPQNIIIPDNRILCSDLCSPGKCCFTDDCDDDEVISCPTYSPCSILYPATEQLKEEVLLSQKVNQACNSITPNSPTKERDACTNLCRDHTCCVNPKEQFGCFTEDDEAYCSDYTACKNLYNIQEKEEYNPTNDTDRNDFQKVQDTFDLNPNEIKDINYDAFDEVKDTFEDTVEDIQMQNEFDKEIVDSINDENFIIEEEETEDEEMQEIQQESQEIQQEESQEESQEEQEVGMENMDNEDQSTEIPEHNNDLSGTATTQESEEQGDTTNMEYYDDFQVINNNDQNEGDFPVVDGQEMAEIPQEDNNRMLLRY